MRIYNSWDSVDILLKNTYQYKILTSLSAVLSLEIKQFWCLGHKSGVIDMRVHFNATCMSFFSLPTTARKMLHFAFAPIEREKTWFIVGSVFYRDCPPLCPLSISCCFLFFLFILFIHISNNHVLLRESMTQRFLRDPIKIIIHTFSFFCYMQSILYTRVDINHFSLWRGVPKNLLPRCDNSGYTTSFSEKIILHFPAQFLLSPTLSFTTILCTLNLWWIVTRMRSEKQYHWVGTIISSFLFCIFNLTMCILMYDSLWILYEPLMQLPYVCVIGLACPHNWSQKTR